MNDLNLMLNETNLFEDFFSNIKKFFDVNVPVDAWGTKWILPYNLSRVDKTTLLYEFALAGFPPENVTIEKSGNVITIAAQTKNENQPEEKDSDDKDCWKSYWTLIHKGITSKNLKFSFVIPFGAEIESDKSVIKDGILKIYLKFNKPDEKTKLKIKIQK